MPILSVSGLRGVVPNDLTPSKLAEVGRAFGWFINGGVCLVARDTRLSGDLASRAVVSGLMFAGCRVVDLGVQPTPVVFKEVASQAADGGVVVTSSHNPPQWNGVKFVVRGGRGLFEEEVQSIGEASGGMMGSYGACCSGESGYADSLLGYLGSESLHGVRVAVDPGGGAGCSIIPMILQRIGCRVYSVNCTAGVFERTIDPTEDPLDVLRHTVVEKRCQAGFAYDCDADRLVIVDERGRKIPSDYTLVLGLKALLQKNARVVVSVDTTCAVEKVVSAAGGKVVTSKVGEANVVKTMLREDCRVGGEGSSGGLIAANFNLCRDGMLASALVAKLIKSAGSLQEALGGIPRTHQIRTKVSCPRGIAQAIMKNLEEGGDRFEHIDGLKIWFGEDTWLLVRPSNTEDALRLSVEAPTRKSAEGLADNYLEKIMRMVKR